LHVVATRTRGPHAERTHQLAALVAATGTVLALRQMDKPGLFVSTDGDVAMGARDYFDSEQLFALQLKKTIVIQCYVRG
jgi:hypothetical protein